MTADQLFALVALVAVAAFTPGPNNALVANSGASFGLQRTWPHVLGIALGFPVMIFLVGFFLGGLFQSSPILRETLRWVGAAILLWLAWKLATSGGLSGEGRRPRPFTFTEAAAFQWINPKAWAMSIAITSQFIRPDAPLTSAAQLGAVCVVIGFASATTWAVMGHGFTRWLGAEHHLRRFNIAMAVVIAACVLLLFMD